MSTLLKHRGYYSFIEASPEDNCMYGKIQFIRALVSYKGETVPELEQAFREAVDDHLATSAEQASDPNHPQLIHPGLKCRTQ